MGPSPANPGFTGKPALAALGGRDRPFPNGRFDSKPKPAKVPSMSRSNPPRKVSAPSASPEESVLTPFELSRVYAKGWLAGMNCEDATSPQVIYRHAEALNPYRNDLERARWLQGFTQAVRRKYGVTLPEGPAADASVPST
jgi:hypothetical protein